MHVFYLISVWLHIMAAVVWVGGTIFLVIVLVPAIRRPQFAGIASALIRFTAVRFRWVGWVCFGVFVFTGIVNLAARGIGWQELQETAFWRGSFGHTLAIKLILVAAILAISGFHDFSLGPRASAAWEANPVSAETLRLRRQAVKLGRLNLLLAVTAIVLGIMLVRGAPW
jgi:putative copper resistance protein D